MVIVLWIVFSLIVGYAGSDKKVGFGGALFFSLLLSPIIGLIIVLVSGNKENIFEKYNYSLDKGKRAEFKEKFDLAEEFFGDALYELGNAERKANGVQRKHIKKLKIDLAERLSLLREKQN
ncbi:MAG: hypothetical protein ABJF11_09015 [Reichenbachiella sp.]|uniref:hypothetical protein n=1 Tax=Reichenbachiella sp. TaxID=2184521 RepID=UPI003263C03B